MLGLCDSGAVSRGKERRWSRVVMQTLRPNPRVRDTGGRQRDSQRDSQRDALRDSPRDSCIKIVIHPPSPSPDHRFQLVRVSFHYSIYDLL